MREIKFRAWDKHKKKMIDNANVRRIPLGYLEDETCTGGAYADELYEFMQYTGLKDKNGKEVYEGDIIKHLFREDTAVIKFGKYHNVFDSQESYHYGFYVDWQTKNTKNTRKDLGYWIEILENSNVIGNIYDNPELLERGAE